MLVSGGAGGGTPTPLPKAPAAAPAPPATNQAAAPAVASSAPAASTSAATATASVSAATATCSVGVSAAPGPSSLLASSPVDLDLLLRFLATLAASLPFKRCDEPLLLMHTLNSVISRRGGLVYARVKQLHQPVSEGGGGGGVAWCMHESSSCINL